MNLEKMIEKVKEYFLKSASFDKIKIAYLTGHVSLEEIVEKAERLYAEEKLEFLLKKGREDLITDSLLKDINLWGWIDILYLIVKGEISVSAGLKDRFIRYFKEALWEHCDSIDEDEFYDLLADGQIKQVVIEVFAGVNPYKFAKIKKLRLSNEMWSEIYKEREKIFNKNKQEVKYKNSFYKAIMENNSDALNRSRIKPQNLSKEDFDFLLPYWLKCDEEILIKILGVPYFNDLPVDLRDDIIVRCAEKCYNEVRYIFLDKDTQMGADIEFSTQAIMKAKDFEVKKLLLNAYLTKCCKKVLSGEDIKTACPDFNNLENIITTIAMCNPQLRYYFLVYKIVAEPNLVVENDGDNGNNGVEINSARYFFDYLLGERIKRIPLSTDIDLYMLMLEFFAVYIPCDEYHKVLAKVLEILKLFVKENL